MAAHYTYRTLCFLGIEKHLICKLFYTFLQTYSLSTHNLLRASPAFYYYVRKNNLTRGMAVTTLKTAGVLTGNGTN